MSILLVLWLHCQNVNLLRDKLIWVESLLERKCFVSNFSTRIRLGLEDPTKITILLIYSRKGFVGVISIII